jgi:hypothetical protein
MQSKAPTVKEYLAELPAERRAAIEQVRGLLLKNMPKGYQEGMSYGMICYSVPHSRYPQGYHCDPKQALPFAGLASQKQYMSVYLCTQYANPKAEARFRAAWDKAVRAGQAKKLDMGKSCIRFKKVEDLALDVIADSVRSMPVDEFIEFYERAILSMNRSAAAKRATRNATGTQVSPPKRKAKTSSARRSKTTRASRTRKRSTVS